MCSGVIWFDRSKVFKANGSAKYLHFKFRTALYYLIDFMQFFDVRVLYLNRIQKINFYQFYCSTSYISSITINETHVVLFTVLHYCVNCFQFYLFILFFITTLYLFIATQQIWQSKMPVFSIKSAWHSASAVPRLPFKILLSYYVSVFKILLRDKLILEKLRSYYELEYGW